MAGPSNIQLTVRVNGGAPQVGPISGGIQVSGGDVIQMGHNNTSGASRYRYEIAEYPLDMTVPAGWTQDPGALPFYYIGPNPPSFTVPASAGIWGNFILKLVIDGGKRPSASRPGEVEDAPDLIDASIGMFKPGTGPLLDVAFGELDQLDQLRNSVYAIRRNWRSLDGLVAGGGEANVISDVGSGVGKLAAGKSGIALQVKSIQAGTNVSIQNNSTELVISATGASVLNTPEDEGAVGDGVADDTAAINASLANHASVHLRPDSVYRITSPIVMQSGNRLTGLGGTGTGGGRILASFSSDTNMVTISGKSNVVIEDVWLQGSSNTDGGAATGHGIYISSSSNVTIRNSDIRSIGSSTATGSPSGIKVVGASTDIRLEGNRIAGGAGASSAGSRDIHISAPAGNSIKITGNWLVSDGIRDGILVENTVSRLEIKDNVVADKQNGVRVGHNATIRHHCTIADNLLYNCGWGGVRLENATSSNCRVVDNILLYCGGAGSTTGVAAISTENATSVEIRGNYIYRAGFTTAEAARPQAGHGIHVPVTASGFTGSIRDNIVELCKSDGIRVLGVEAAQVQDNRVLGALGGCYVFQTGGQTSQGQQLLFTDNMGLAYGGHGLLINNGVDRMHVSDNFLYGQESQSSNGFSGIYYGALAGGARGKISNNYVENFANGLFTNSETAQRVGREIRVRNNTLKSCTVGAYFNAISSNAPWTLLEGQDYIDCGTNVSGSGAQFSTLVKQALTVSPQRIVLANELPVAGNGTWSVGDVVRTISPPSDANAPYKWVCSAAGDPGTWIPYTRSTSVSASGTAAHFTWRPGSTSASANVFENLSELHQAFLDADTHVVIHMDNVNSSTFTPDVDQVYDWLGRADLIASKGANNLTFNQATAFENLKSVVVPEASSMATIATSAATLDYVFRWTDPDVVPHIEGTIFRSTTARTLYKIETGESSSSNRYIEFGKGGRLEGIASDGKLRVVLKEPGITQSSGSVTKIGSFSQDLTIEYWHEVINTPATIGSLWTGGGSLVTDLGSNARAVDLSGVVASNWTNKGGAPAEANDAINKLAAYQPIDNVTSPGSGSTIIQSVSGGTLGLKTISGSGGLVVTSTSTNIDIDASGVSGGGGGENNTASNVGGGLGIFHQKVGSNLELRSLVLDGQITGSVIGNTVSMDTGGLVNTITLSGDITVKGNDLLPSNASQTSTLRIAHSAPKIITGLDSSLFGGWRGTLVNDSALYEMMVEANSTDSAIGNQFLMNRNYSIPPKASVVVSRDGGNGWKIDDVNYTFDAGDAGSWRRHQVNLQFTVDTNSISVNPINFWGYDELFGCYGMDPSRTLGFTGEVIQISNSTVGTLCVAKRYDFSLFRRPGTSASVYFSPVALAGSSSSFTLSVSSLSTALYLYLNSSSAVSSSHLVMIKGELFHTDHA